MIAWKSWDESRVPLSDYVPKNTRIQNREKAARKYYAASGIRQNWKPLELVFEHWRKEKSIWNGRSIVPCSAFGRNFTVEITRCVFVCGYETWYCMEYSTLAMLHLFENGTKIGVGDGLPFLARVHVKYDYRSLSLSIESSIGWYLKNVVCSFTKSFDETDKRYKKRMVPISFFCQNHQ